MPVNRNEITNGTMLSDALEQGMNPGELATRLDGRALYYYEKVYRWLFPLLRRKDDPAARKICWAKVCSGGRRGTSKPRWRGTGSIFPLSS